MLLEPQATTAKTETPPAAPQAPGTPVFSSGAGTLDLAGKSYNQLKAMYDQLSSQRSDFASRRQNLAPSYERATGVNREGIGSRLATLDNNVMRLENQLGQVSQQMALVAPPYSNPPIIRTGMRGGDVFGISLLVFLATMVTMVPLAVRRARARWMRQGAGPTNIGAPPNDRLDRIEHAVDTIAIEIERVSENQRFMTRLMTETQLAGTIAQVRSSTEMAKSVAEAESK